MKLILRRHEGREVQCFVYEATANQVARVIEPSSKLRCEDVRSTCGSDWRWALVDIEEMATVAAMLSGRLGKVKAVTVLPLEG